MSWNAANILTLSRLAAVPFFVLFYSIGRHDIMFWLFCYAAATDLIDGAIARKFYTPSNFGAVIDPIADKLLMQSCFVILLLSSILPWQFFVLALCRDIMIVIGMYVLIRKRAKMHYGAIISSKFATLLQIAMTVLGLFILWSPVHYISYDFLNLLFIILLYSTAVLIIISGGQYIHMGLRLLKNTHLSSINNADH